MSGVQASACQANLDVCNLITAQAQAVDTLSPASASFRAETKQVAQHLEFSKARRLAESL
eukprot:m.233100 g.233100  ORF g.233100 m.233100 type:complete len:60 (+) comp15242_c4_seq1:119-298(+)